VGLGDLLDEVLNARGGLDKWRQFTQVQVSVVTGSGLWAIKGNPRIHCRGGWP